MAQYPSFTITTALGELRTIRLTKKAIKELAMRARSNGHFTQGHDRVANATVVWVQCPLCRGRVEGYAGGYPRVTVVNALDKAMVDHLVYDCPRVDRPEVR